MTEQRIFDLLLKNNNTYYNFDFPKLQGDAVNIISKKFTDTIYETLKQKSSVSNIKRGSILKFINNSCEVKDAHLNEENYEFFLQVVKNSFKTSDNEDITKLVSEAQYDLNYYIPNKLSDSIVEFYKKKQSKRKEKVKCLEFIKMLDQEHLNKKFDMQLRKSFGYYETNENIIRELLDQSSCDQTKDKSISYETENHDFREKQIKFGYAVINLKNKNLWLVEKIIQKLSEYKSLKEFEINFLQYLWLAKDDTTNLQDTVIEKFPFILERVIVIHSTELLMLSEESDICQYFIKLEDDKKFARIRKICNKDPGILYKLKSLIYQLYCFSYCNENLLKLIDFIT